MFWRTAICALLLSTAVAQADMKRVTVEAIMHAQASLSVSASAGPSVFTPSEIEAIGTYELVTVTPWREKPATFVGARLADILKANGLEDAKAVRVIAENDYAVVLDRSVWAEHDALVATRVDGRPHSRRARGPLQIVFDMSGNAAYGETAFEGNWVWMAARIEPVE